MVKVSDSCYVVDNVFRCFKCGKLTKDIVNWYCDTSGILTCQACNSG